MGRYVRRRSSRQAHFRAAGHSISDALKGLDPAIKEIVISHLGEGDIHHTAYPHTNTSQMRANFVEAVEDCVQACRDSFSAEHGVGVSKLDTMRGRKYAAALDLRRARKQAVDPKGIMKAGDVYPS